MARSTNEALAHIRGHLGGDQVPDDFTFEPDDYSATEKTIRDPAFARLHRAIARALEIATSASPPEPSSLPSDRRIEFLHPEIRRVSERLFRDGHPGAAIFEAFKAVNNRVKTMSGLGLDGKGLMARVFDEQQPLLRINQGTGRSNTDEQEGFKFIFMGAMLGIRNPKAHEELAHIDDDRSLEYLALASILMRRLDDTDAMHKK